MRLPNADEAEVDIGKLKDYCLNPKHEVGKHKARVFAAALKLGIEECESLRDKLLEAAQKNEAKPGVFDKYGQRYIVEFEMEHNGNTAVVRSVWIIDTDKRIPRLITCLIV